MAKFTDGIIFFLWKRINQHVTSVGQRKNLRLRQDSNLWPPKHRAGALCPLKLRRTHGERRHIYILGSYLTRVLHTARISNVDVVLCGERMKDGKFLSSKKQMWKWINQHVGEQGKNLRPHQDSNLWPSKHRVGALSTELRRTHGERGHAYCKNQQCRCRTVWWKNVCRYVCG